MARCTLISYSNKSSQIVYDAITPLCLSGFMHTLVVIAITEITHDLTYNFDILLTLSVHVEVLC